MIKKLTSNNIDYIEQIFNLEKEIFKSSAFSKSYLNTLIKGDNSFIYVYLIDDKVCGYLMILDSIDVYEILAIAAVEEYRNKGIDKKSMSKLEWEILADMYAVNMYGHTKVLDTLFKTAKIAQLIYDDIDTDEIKYRMVEIQMNQLKNR